MQDITARKQQEDELRKFNRMLRTITDSDQAMMRATDEAAYLQEVLAFEISVREVPHCERARLVSKRGSTLI